MTDRSYEGANMSLRLRDQTWVAIRAFKQGDVAARVAAPVAPASRRLRTPGGWVNWHVNRGRMSPVRSDRDMRRVSWRRAL
jgi:hypothetical protein